MSNKELNEILLKLKQQPLTDEQRAKIYAIDILLSNEPQRAIDALIAFAFENPQLRVFALKKKPEGKQKAG